MLRATINRARVVTECLDEHEKYINHMSWLSQSPDLTPIEHLWEIVERHLGQSCPPPSTKHQMMEFIVEEWCCTRIYAKVLWSCSGSWLPNTLLDTLSVLLLFWQIPETGNAHHSNEKGLGKTQFKSCKLQTTQRINGCSLQYARCCIQGLTIVLSCQFVLIDWMWTRK